MKIKSVISILILTLAGCTSSEDKLLDGISNQAYSYQLCENSCDSSMLTDAKNKARIAGIDEKRIEAAEIYGSDRGSRAKESIVRIHREKLKIQCDSKDRDVCFDKCCTYTRADVTARIAAEAAVEATDAAVDATAAAADATAEIAAADATAAAADATVGGGLPPLIVETTSYEDSLAVAIDYSMKSYRVFYALDFQDEYPPDVYPPKIRDEFKSAKNCYLNCGSSTIYRIAVEKIYKWIIDNPNIDPAIRRTATIDMDVYIQRSNGSYTKQSVDAAADYAKNAAKPYYPKLQDP